jgi:hypothetical protein
MDNEKEKGMGKGAPVPFGILRNGKESNEIIKTDKIAVHACRTGIQT